MANGRPLFGLDIAALVHDALAGQLTPGVLYREVQGPRDPLNLAGGRSKVVQQHSFEGLVLQELAMEREQWKPRTTTVEARRKVLILSRSIAVEPKPDDELEIAGRRHVVEGVEEDPAQATFTCTVRD